MVSDEAGTGTDSESSCCVVRCLISPQPSVRWGPDDVYQGGRGILDATDDMYLWAKFWVAVFESVIIIVGDDQVVSASTISASSAAERVLV